MTGNSYSSPIFLSIPAAIPLSAGLTEEARTRTSTSFGAGVGAGRSLRSAGGVSNASRVTALISGILSVLVWLLTRPPGCRVCRGVGWSAASSSGGCRGGDRKILEAGWGTRRRGRASPETGACDTRILGRDRSPRYPQRPDGRVPRPEGRRGLRDRGSHRHPRDHLPTTERPQTVH